MKILILILLLSLTGCYEEPRGYGDPSPTATNKCVRAANMPNEQYVFECKVLGDVFCYIYNGSISCVYFKEPRYVEQNDRAARIR